MLAELAALAGAGLARIFEHCEGFNRSDDLLAWMRAHSMTPATQYVNWVGRTVLQIREEAALHAGLRERLKRDAATFGGQSPLEIHRQLAASVRQDGPPLTPPAPTPLPWLASKIGNMIGVPLALVALLPLFVVIAPFFLWELRRREKSDPVIAPRPDTGPCALPERARGP